MANTHDRKDGAADDGAKLHAFPEAGSAGPSVGRLDQALAYGSDLVARLRVWFRREAASFGLTEQQAAERMGGAAVAVVIAIVVVTLLARLVGFVGDTAAPHLAGWWKAGLRAAGVGGPAHNPVKTYLVGHAVGLPWDGQTLLYGWVVAGLVVWMLADDAHCGGLTAALTPVSAGLAPSRGRVTPGQGQPRCRGQGPIRLASWRRRGGDRPGQPCVRRRQGLAMASLVATPWPAVANPAWTPGGHGGGLAVAIGHRLCVVADMVGGTGRHSQRRGVGSAPPGRPGPGSARPGPARRGEQAGGPVHVPAATSDRGRMIYPLHIKPGGSGPEDV